jgi:hypothetical protein
VVSALSSTSWIKGKNMPLVSESVANAKSEIDRLSREIDGWARDFVELLDRVKHLDLVFTETAEMHPAYIALTDWNNPMQLLVVQTIPLTASEHQLNIARAIVSVITALLFRFGHFDVGVAVLAEDGGKVFHHEVIGAHCRSTLGCARIAEAESQFSSIPGHISQSPSPVVLN